MYIKPRNDNIILGIRNILLISLVYFLLQTRIFITTRFSFFGKPF